MGLFDWLSFGFDIIPGLGEIKGVLEFIYGKDIVTQEDLNAFDRAASAISIIPVAGWLSKLTKLHKTAKHAKKFEKFFKIVDKANKANNAIDKCNLIQLLFEESTFKCGETVSDFNDYEYENDYLKSLDEISDEVIKGYWGNGYDRRRRLEEAGYDYQDVQDEVNRKLYG